MCDTIYGIEIIEIINLKNEELKPWLSNYRWIWLICNTLEDAHKLFQCLQMQAYRWNGGETLSLSASGLDSDKNYPHCFAIDPAMKCVRHGEPMSNLRHFIYKKTER